MPISVLFGSAGDLDQVLLHQAANGLAAGNAANRLIQAEALWAMQSPENFPENEFYKAWRNVALYDEHTWGAHNSVSEPDLPFVTGQWKIKQRFALVADSLSRTLLAEVAPFSATPRQNKIAIEVYNLNSWPRTDLVFLSREQSSLGDLVVDENGNSVPSQRLSTGELAPKVVPICMVSGRLFRAR